MAANKSVIVLAPNGRRQTVKVTINTTILQVLEEVCQKQGFNVDDYDLKHGRQILDPNTIFRFTGLPNNAQLEMVACTKTRSLSNVTISIQPENGERVMCEFPPTTTLAQILRKLYPDSDLKRAVLIYMHREVYGEETLERTTLKSLGLSGGRAILRLIYRDPEQLKTQAHISTPLVPKPVVALDSSQNEKENQKVSMPHCSKEDNDATSSTERISSVKNQRSLESEKKLDRKDESINTTDDKDREMDVCTRETNQSVAKSHNNHDRDQNVTEACAKIQEDAYEIKFLSERNGLVFNQAEAQALPRDELPDSFFVLDLHDAKTLLRDAKRRREELEDAPLLTETQRQLDRDKHTLDMLNKYRNTVIRIQFPDQFVLQGVFGLVETVQHVKDFVKNHLDNPECEFSIYKISSFCRHYPAKAYFEP
ncbi:tether containing UBX domain for GLUT4 isoform X2 [Pseudomyrmex gracilis]|uniref:tether containing UBX domain for GLUT4 isoform X2 n=1 Tax=Pseudomyrmex gracilis TaxID=219809 RepID=UPI0009953A73|nr:tether containing UBX domain for GLUT4 isoform X2 [Pseudomyrmex gracilis]